MLFREEKFYHEALDLRIPELAKAAELFDKGDKPGAEQAFAGYIKKALDPKRYFDSGKQDRIPAGWSREQILARADRVCEGEVISVGFAYRYPDNVFDWEINPTYNQYAEWTWQLSRHSEFVWLANAYELTSDEKYALQYRNMILSWIRQCTCPESVSGYATKTWRTIEAGIRMLGSWHNAIHRFLYSPSLQDGDWVLIFRSIYEHAYRLLGFRTTHNWLIMEMGGVVHLSLLYPFFREADDWYRDAMQTLTDQIEQQVYPDDFQFELTNGYHGGIITDYRRVIDICQKCGKEIPAEFLDGLYRMYRLYTKLAQPDRQTPCLNDGGTNGVKTWSERALTLFPDDPTFQWFATDGAEGKEPEFGSLVMPYSGFAILRQSWEPDAIWALLDAGPFGYAHQHEDKLNFLMFAYGTNMLPDSGNYAYDDSDQRRYILDTRSHNTGLVDGLGQNRRENYHWDSSEIRKKAAGLTCRFGEIYDTAEGLYDEAGYGRVRIGEERNPAHVEATHRRKVIFFRKGWKTLPPFFVLLDDFSAETGSHTFEVSFQLTADPVTVRNGTVQVRYPNGTALILCSDVYPTLATGQYAPEYKGWRSIESRLEHEHQPAPVVAFPKTGTAAAFATLVLPLKDGCAPSGLRVRRTPDSFTLEQGEVSETFRLSDFPTDPA